ncbi:MAG: DUF1801 domain-containing protein [Acidimicrobiia bacterium]|nr:MAG: DUF1801 domain-containing protein [Acidimicrobiia bacterium]
MCDGEPTVDGYLASLPPDRRPAMEEVRRVILDSLPDGYEEAVEWGMLSYRVPLSVYPDTYNGKPLLYAGLASQKRHMAVYLMAVYLDEAVRATFEEEYRATGKRYDAGKSCIRFKRLEDLPLELVARAIANLPVEEFVARARAAREARRR